MISKPESTECYVYITLPEQTTAVTAGRFELSHDRHGTAIGRFVFGRSYLARADAVSVDPFELRLSPRVYETTLMKGVFGALRDAGPDHWGRRVIDKHAHKPEQSELDYLLNSADDRAGALGFGLGQQPPAPRRNFNQTLQMQKLQAIADAVMAEDDRLTDAAAAQISELLLVGTSMGGARPKAVVEDDEGLWLAKFNRPDDRWNNARVEHAMLTLARACGLNVAESKVMPVAGRDVLLVKRFDRERTPHGYLRARMISALTLLRAEDTHHAPRDKWSYVLLAEEVRRTCAEPKKEAAELFRRMCFNALISNTDDHPRNHALIAKEQDWKLSPAYDLTPTSPVSLEQRNLALTCGDWGRYANAENLLSQSARFLLERDEAVKIIDLMEAQVRESWYRVVRSVGMTERDCESVRGAFAYPGFRMRPASYPLGRRWR